MGVVDVEAAAFHEAAGIAFGGGEAEGDEEIGDLRDVGEIDFRARRGGGGFDEGADIGGGEISTAKQGLGGEDDFLQFVFAVHHAGDFGGEAFVTAAEFGAGVVLGLDGFDFFVREQRELAQEARHIGVLGVHPELVEGVGACLGGVHPDGTGFGLAEFFARARGDEREGDHVGLLAAHFAHEVDAGGHVAPLVAAADLHGAAVALIEHHKVIGLQDHVGEFGERDAAFETGADGFLGEHPRDGEVLAHVAQQLDGAEFADPGGVVFDDGLLGNEDAADLHFDAFDECGDGLRRVERSFVRLAAGIADQTGAAADDGDGLVPMLLHATQCHERQQVADVQAVGGGIKAAVERLRCLEGFLEGFEVAALLEQAAPFEIGDQVGRGHERKK